MADVERQLTHASSYTARAGNSKSFWPVLKFALITAGALLIAVIGLLDPGDMLRSRSQFKGWYGQYVIQLTNITRENCTEAYSTYLYGTRQNTSQPTMTGAGKYTLFVQPMIECLLEGTSEYIKYQFSCSQVMLGLTPTIITLLGASSEEVCLLALIGKRRFLGLFLTAAAPSIYTERAFKFQDPDKILREKGSEDQIRKSMHKDYRLYFVLAEYVVVWSSIINVATLNWQLGTRSINAIQPNTPLMPMLWSFLGIAAHLAGAVVFDLRVRPVDSEGKPIPSSTLNTVWARYRDMKKHGFTNMIRTIGLDWKEVVIRAFCLKNQGGDEKLYFRVMGEGEDEYKGGAKGFTVLAWIHSVCVVFQLIFGTLIMSSTNFVGPKDAITIMARYLASVVACRIILVYELAVLRVEYLNAQPKKADNPENSSVETISHIAASK